MSPTSSPAPQGIKNIVLVHGALADGSSWAKVISLLQASGYHVAAVQNPLTSLADDVASTTRAIARQDGPVLLVGHSYAGMVITEAGNNPQVAGLAYIAAYVPNVGQAMGEVAQQGPPPAGGQNMRPDAAGFLTSTPEGVIADLGFDLTPTEQQVFIATQQPLAMAAAGEKVKAAAWQTKPAWYLIARDDRTINPDLQRAMAEKINAEIHLAPGSHLLVISQPEAVAAFIQEAAQQAGAR